MPETAYISDTALSILRRVQQKRPAPERCELCSLPLESRHTHLLDPSERRIVCACDPCAFLFQEPGQRYRRIPRDAFFLANYALEDLQWQALSVPINLAFFFFSSVAKRALAFYPSPGGATESLLNLESWEEVAASHPRVQQMQPDVEAFLVNRLATPPEYYIVPIDRCYELSGIVRKHWKGFNGGDEVWREIAAFFTDLRQHAITVGATRA